MEKLLKSLGEIIRYTFTTIGTIAVFVILLAFDFGFWPSLIISLLIGGLMLYKKDGIASSSKIKVRKLKRITPEKEAFYRSKGLSKEEMNFFRETMQAVKITILDLEQNMQKSTKLTAIEKRNNSIHLAKALFKDITNQPNRLHEVDQFLYVHLPSLRDLTAKYIEVEGHQVKQKATFEILEESANMIDGMCNLIAKDYVAFKSDDIDDIELEIELAKQTMARNNGTNEITNEEL